MGLKAQTQTPQPVYYDTEQGQYYTVKPQQNYNPVAYALGQNQISNRYANNPENRNYLGSPYANSSATQFTPKFIQTTYPDMNMLFPTLNTGLLQDITSSVQPTGAMYGAGRFLSPQTTSESKGK
jgi:hypothetical protein